MEFFQRRAEPGRALRHRDVPNLSSRGKRNSPTFRLTTRYLHSASALEEGSLVRTVTWGAWGAAHKHGPFTFLNYFFFFFFFLLSRKSLDAVKLGGTNKPHKGKKMAAVNQVRAGANTPRSVLHFLTHFSTLQWGKMSLHDPLNHCSFTAKKKKILEGLGGGKTSEG